MKKSQSEMILDHIRRHGSINPLQALRNYGCLRLSARICDLKQRGFNIVAKLIRNKNKRFASYSLE